MKKVYIVRKYIVAESVAEALRKEKKTKVDDCWAEEKTLNQFIENLVKPPEKKPCGFESKK